MESIHFSSQYPVKTRFEEVSTLLSYIKMGGVSEVVGMQGVGRSVFLGLLAYNRKLRELHLPKDADEYHFVLIDFATLKRAKEEEVWKTLFSSLLSSLEERRYMNNYKRVKELFAEAVSYNDLTLLFQGFKSAMDYLLLERKMTVVFLLDTFEVYAPSLSESFFERVKVLQDRYRYSLSLVFSSSHPIDQLVSAEVVDTAQRFTADHTLYLGVFDKVGYEYLLSYLEEHFGKKISQELASEVRKLTGGHAKMSKVIIEELLTHDIKQSEIEDFVKNNKSIRSVNQEIWQDLFPREQLFLRNIVQNFVIPAKAGTCLPAGRSRKSWIPDQVGDDILMEGESLQKLGILDEELNFQIPLFEDFVLSISSKPLEHSFDLNLTTGEILKGDIVVSDFLTKYEYKLLRYFLQNSSSVLSRDDISIAAWGEVRAEEGISDQAIDQLVFRLRKKVEDDPNAPHHIQTVKGRGFVFKVEHE